MAFRRFEHSQLGSEEGGWIESSDYDSTSRMPSRLGTPVLTVDPAKMHEVDTRNAESLHGMWMVFSRCADYMEEGRRLENLSWRLWNRETFCVAPEPILFRRGAVGRMRTESKELPELSSSVESAASDEAERIESHIKCPPSTLDIKPAIVGEDPTLSNSRGKEKHISSTRLEKMVYKIKERKSLEPLAPESASESETTPQTTVEVTPRSASPTPTPKATEPQRPVRLRHSSDSCSTAANDSEDQMAAASDTSISSAGMIQSSSVVRGFSPSHISSSHRSHTQLTSSSIPKPTVLLKPSPLKKKGGMFTLGGSSGDDESSFEDRMVIKPQRSSLTDGLSHTQQRTLGTLSNTGLNAIKPIREGTDDDEDAIETDDEEISESAIEDDDDSSDWEDSVTESGRSTPENKELFQRVDSRPNLVSRRSLLTMMIHQPQRNMVPPGKNGANSRSTPAFQRSQLSTPNAHSVACSPDDEENTLTMKGPEVPRSKPIVVRNVSHHSGAHSPRTTRRNMLATELTESLRRHLLWERQQKTAPAAQAFKRRHTAHDMANLQEYPGPRGLTNGERPALPPQSQTQPPPQQHPSQAFPAAVQQTKERETSKNNSWNHYFDYGPWEYHVKGW